MTKAEKKKIIDQLKPRLEQFLEERLSRMIEDNFIPIRFNIGNETMLLMCDAAINVLLATYEIQDFLYEDGRLSE